MSTISDQLRLISVCNRGTNWSTIGTRVWRNSRDV